jgi:zinc transport system substrate-binding protein
MNAGFVRWMAGIVGLSAVMALLLSGCSKAPDPWKDVPGGQPRVLVTFPTLYCFAKAVAGPDVAVMSMLEQTGPHDHKPAPEDALKLRKADIFLYNGLSLDDHIARRAINNSGQTNFKAVAVGDLLPDHLKYENVAGGGHEHGPGEEHHAHGPHDPHAWLGLKQAVEMVKIIEKTLAEKDPSRKDEYAQRAKDFIKELEDLRAYGLQQLKGKKSRHLVTMHDSFRYFAGNFDLTTHYYQQRPGIDPGNKEQAELEKIIIDNNVHVIAVEPQYKAAGVDALIGRLRAKGRNLTKIELDPIETASGEQFEREQGRYYTRVMRANIDKLAKALP